MKGKNVLIISAVMFLIVVFIFIGKGFYPKEESFSVKTILIKLKIPLDGEGASEIRVTNNKDISQNFKIYINGLEYNGIIEDNEFTIGPGEFKDVGIVFKNEKEGVSIHSGRLIVEGESEKKTIPIIIGIEDPNQVFTIIQKGIPRYDEVYPGGRMGVEVKIFDLAYIDLQSVEAQFSVQDMDDEIIWSENGNLVIGGDVTKIINIPEKWSYGDYIFITSVEHNGVKTISGYLFTISEKKGEVFSGSLKFFMIVIILFISGILVLFFYFLQSRDELFSELKNQHEKEIINEMRLINISKKKVKRLRNPVKRKEKVRRLNVAKKKILKKIKKRQKTQRKELKKLRKYGKKDLMKRKVNLWKEQGYKMFKEEEKQIKKVTSKEAEKQISKWKKAGYRY